MKELVTQGAAVIYLLTFMKNFLTQLASLLIPTRIRPSTMLGPKIVEIAGNKVVSGPFKGMKYTGGSVGSVFIPKVLGTYELELAPLIDKLCHIPFDTIIDIGAAEGYYAVGLCRNIPHANVIAYEVERQGRDLMREMARLNEVEERLTIRGLCEASSLTIDLAQADKCLVVMDIEGSESVFLDPFIFPRLEQAHILVELHDFVISDLGAVIAARFSTTHEITEVKAKARTMSNFPLSLSILPWKLPSAYVAKLMSEHRPPGMRWLYLEPRIVSSQGLLATKTYPLDR